jgi:hypothetical protein
MRAYIIGNGPSLQETNLDLIKGQPSFACNGIDLIYEKTEWRPTQYVRAEGEFPEEADKSIWWNSVKTHLDLGIPCHLSGYYWHHFKDYGNAIELKHCHEHAVNFDSPNAPSEWHLPYPCIFGGSLIVAMQIAVIQGYDQLVLLGCDLNYRDNKPSHFDETYEHGYEQPARYANLNNLWGHICGIQYHGRRNLPFDVVNATIGGDLHLYPRVDLEDLA